MIITKWLGHLTFHDVHKADRSLCRQVHRKLGGNSQHGTPRLFSQLTWRWQQLSIFTDLKSRAKAQRRDPDSIIILPGLSPIIAGTEAEAKQIAKELNELTDVEVGRKRLIGRFGGYDFSHLPLDRPLTQNDFPDPSTVQAARSRAEVIVGMVTREKPTLRQLLAKLAGARGHFIFAGTPEQVANELELWFKSGAADGFNLMPPIIPWMLEVFVEEVVPLLQQRGLFRKEYKGSMLRDHYGLERPSVKLS